MKKIFTILMCIWAITIYAQENNIIRDSIYVKGNCEMCKENIENAVQSIPNAKGNWDVDSKILKFTYDKNETTKKKIMQRIAEAGYDNEMYSADEEDYMNLASCCHYDRDTSWEEIKKQGENPDNETSDDWLTNNDAIVLNDVKIEGNKAQTALDAKSIGLTFKIDKGELLKAACCNLAESFETNATVDVSYSNAVTGAKQIKMLGLDQKYTLITKELMPDIRGLATPYGMNFIPGRWISGIQLTKGGSTVTNGYESISGQINTEIQKFESKPITSLNLFMDLQSRIEGNLVWADSINSKWSNSVLLHANVTLNKLDQNNDNFIDQPIGKQINVGYNLHYNDLANSGIGSHFGVNILNDQRVAGSMDFDKNIDKLGNNHYGVGIDIDRFQIWNKTGYIFKGKPYQSLGWMNQYTHHQQNSYFGQSLYTGKENTFYSNFIFESILGSTLHKYKTGLSFLYDDFDEVYKNQSYLRTEKVPGAFAEYTYTGDKLTMVLGGRVDFHNLAGTQFTPRVNFKYDFTHHTTLRLSGGRGFRTANVFAESQSYLASNRTVEIQSNHGNIYGLSPEIAWNYGISLNQNFKFFRNKSNIIIDFFRTNFENQIVPDLDESPHSILFYNMKGNSYANALQIQWDFEPIRRLEVRLAYKNYQTKAHYQSGEKELPFTAKHRGFANIAYVTFKNAKGQNWSFDTTIQWIGKQRIPNTRSNPIELQLPQFSEPYFLLNAQIARQFSKSIRMYVGGENLLSYHQDKPIIDVNQPFGQYFDGGMIWAPIMPGNIYAGLDINF